MPMSIIVRICPRPESPGAVRAAPEPVIYSARQRHPGRYGIEDLQHNGAAERPSAQAGHIPQLAWIVRELCAVAGR